MITEQLTLSVFIKNSSSDDRKMKLCVIGAGAAGLISIKHGIDYGLEVIAFELSKTVGGLWNYTDEVDKDEYGIDIHSSMYQNLLTNLPIEVMCYPGEPFREQKESFVSSHEVLNYYQSYADKFGLRKYVKLEHYVVRVRPVSSGWEVIVKNLPTDTYETYKFDAVLVCSGHYHTSSIPDYEGQQVFQGKQIHSHVYRNAENYQGEKVLVIGGAYSGSDVVIETSKYADRVVWSHHLTEKSNRACFRENVVQRPDVAKLTSKEVEFVDGSYEEISVIIYCTGYEYKLPFLSVDCGINTTDGYVKPLFMHCLNINRPTLGFIGINNLICPNQTFHLQTLFFLTFLTGQKKLPSKDEMMNEFEAELEERQRQRLMGKKFHSLGGEKLLKYLSGLAEKSGIEPLMPCVPKMYLQCLENRKADFLGFRNLKFNVVDNENFTMTKL